MILAITVAPTTPAVPIEDREQIPTHIHQLHPEQSMRYHTVTQEELRSTPATATQGDTSISAKQAIDLLTNLLTNYDK